MKIDGAGGCFENRMYDVDRQTAWKLVKECIKDMDLAVEVVDDDKQVASGKMEKSIGKGFLASLFQNSHKLFQAAVQDVDSEYEGEVGMVQVLFDVHKKVPTAYQWGKDDKQVVDFYERFEKKLEDTLHFAICPQCKSKIKRGVKFCPNCGASMTAKPETKSPETKSPETKAPEAKVTETKK
jgi:hypothetical protein